MKKSIFLGTAIILASLTISVEGSLTNPSITHSSNLKAVHANKEELIKIISNFLEKVRMDKLEDAYNNFTSKQFRNDSSLNDFTAIVKSNIVLSKNKIFQYQSFYVEDEIATFQGDLVATDGTNVPAEFDFVQEDNSWKIMGLQLFHPETQLLPTDILQTK